MKLYVFCSIKSKHKTSSSTQYNDNHDDNAIVDNDVAVLNDVVQLRVLLSVLYEEE